jgi:hypothetical protein
MNAENVLGGEVYVSDDETGFSSPVTQRVHQLPKQKDQKMEIMVITSYVLTR